MCEDSAFQEPLELQPRVAGEPLGVDGVEVGQEGAQVPPYRVVQVRVLGTSTAVARRLERARRAGSGGHAGELRRNRANIGQRRRPSITGPEVSGNVRVSPDSPGQTRTQPDRSLWRGSFAPDGA